MLAAAGGGDSSTQQSQNLSLGIRIIFTQHSAHLPVKWLLLPMLDVDVDPLGFASSDADPPFCVPADPTPRLAVLGIVSTERTAWRASVRQSTMRFAPQVQVETEGGVLIRLLLRGINCSQAVRNESERHGDIIFLPAPADLSAGRGPLISTLLWLQCASGAWRNAHFIGKAEDDVWIHVPDVISSLRASRAALGKLAVQDVYWGMFETYYFNETAQRPFGFGHYHPWSMWAAPCRLNATGNTSGTTRGVVNLDARHRHHGPFSYSKGPLYFLSRGLAERVSRDGPTLRRAAEALATTDERRSGGLGGTPDKRVWEDVFLGYSLSRLDPAPRLGLVSINFELYFEEWGFRSLPGTMVWHAKTKEARRPPVLHKWMAEHHCSRGEPSPPPRCRDSSTGSSTIHAPPAAPGQSIHSYGGRGILETRGGSCTGGKWVFCVDDAPSRRRCPRTVVDVQQQHQVQT
jgi:hypothetical protein